MLFYPLNYNVDIECRMTVHFCHGKENREKPVRLFVYPLPLGWFPSHMGNSCSLYSLLDVSLMFVKITDDLRFFSLCSNIIEWPIISIVQLLHQTSRVSILCTHILISGLGILLKGIGQGQESLKCSISNALYSPELAQNMHIEMLQIDFFRIMIN